MFCLISSCETFDTFVDLDFGLPSVLMFSLLLSFLAPFGLSYEFFSWVVFLPFVVFIFLREGSFRREELLKILFSGALAARLLGIFCREFGSNFGTFAFVRVLPVSESDIVTSCR